MASDPLVSAAFSPGWRSVRLVLLCLLSHRVKLLHSLLSTLSASRFSQGGHRLGGTRDHRTGQ